MVYTGRVENGVVVLDNGAELPEGIPVRIEPLTTAAESHQTGGYEDLLEFAGTINDLPSDLSRNLDHYLYGLPKK